MGFKIKKFSEINLEDIFFNSLKDDYEEFSDWFRKKSADPSNKVLIHLDDEEKINGFLYVKEEYEELDIIPLYPKLKRLKIGTMKIDAHGTKLGERFIKKIFDYAFHLDVDEIYVTIFPKHTNLIQLFEKYDFSKIGVKQSTNGEENVYSRFLKGDCREASYPFIQNTSSTQYYFLAIQPVFHSRLFPDSILNTEDRSIVTDISPTNSIHKIYISNIQGLCNVKKEDILVIYRTAEEGKSAYYSSVFTSICCVEDYQHISRFKNYQEFYDYCHKHSIFNENELETIYHNKKYNHIVKMSYNVALKKRINRAKLIQMGIMKDCKSFYSGFGTLSIDQLLDVLKEGAINESLIINKA
jgi:L-amino acid N-acyltransferase YncA